MDERAKALAALASERWRVALLLTLAMMFFYRNGEMFESPRTSVVG